MRIALDARECLDPATGMGRYALEVIPRLAKRARHEWVVVAPEGAPLPAALAGASVETLRVPAPAYALREHAVLPLALRRHGIEHLHALTYALPLVATVPTSLTLFDPVPLLLPAGYGLRARAYWHTVLPLTARRARGIVTLSQRAARDVAAALGLAGRRFRVLPAGVGPPFGDVPVTDAERALARLGIRRPYVLAHGNRRPHKNLGALTAAHMRLRSLFPELTLVLSGGGGAPSREAEAGAAGGLRDVGGVDDGTLAALYAGAAAYVLPSHYEGAGLTPLEAMACGAPCVLSDRGALPELYGCAAHLAAPEPEALAAAIGALLASPAMANALRAAGRELAVRSTWDRAAAAFEDALSGFLRA